MRTVDFSFNAKTMQESLRCFSLGVADCCPVPSASMTIGRRINAPYLIQSAQEIGNTIFRGIASESNPLTFSPADVTQVFDYSSYDWELSTEDNFESENYVDLGQFATTRQRLDYEYHSHYKTSRQSLQDDIIESFLADHPIQKESGADQWIIFSAGCMGAGKTHTLRKVSNNDAFSLDLKSFVSVDPDEIRRKLPEFSMYIEKDPLSAGENTRKEAGMLAEILTEEALKRGNNVLVDGSLKDAEWYKTYFEVLRKKYPRLKLGIIHVTAPLKDVIVRVQRRAKETGRMIPMDVLFQSMEQVPKSVGELCRHVDLFIEIDNSSGHDIRFTMLNGVGHLNSGDWKIAIQ